MAGLIICTFHGKALPLPLDCKRSATSCNKTWKRTTKQYLIMKHLIKATLLLLVLLLLTMVSCSGNQSVPNSDSTFEVNGINYNKIDSNEVEVTNKITSYSPYSNDYSGSVTIPATVTYHGTTYSVTSIGYGAFDHCYGLTNINIPKSVTNIDRYAFRGCSSLTNINIPNSVTSIGDEAFDGCSSLTSINIPNSVTDITNSAFSCCSSLENISVASNNTNYDSRNNCNAIIKTATNTLIAGCKNTTIPNSVTSIGAGAFLGRSSLTAINIPNSVTSIQWIAFAECTSLSSIDIPNSVTNIDDWAFLGCSGLTAINIPNSVTTIGDGAFSCCSSLENISVVSDNPNYDSRNNCNAIIETATNTLIAGCMNTAIPNSVTSIGDKAFSGCSSLTSIMIPNSVTTIGNDAFEGCSGLTAVNIPNSVTSIGNRAFSNCSSLTSIMIPNSVTTIGDEAFSDCPSLNDIYCYVTTPPRFENYDSINYSATLHVPATSLAAYRAAPIWSKFKNIVGDAVAPNGYRSKSR